MIAVGTLNLDIDEFRKFTVRFSTHYDEVHENHNARVWSTNT